MKKKLKSVEHRAVDNEHPAQKDITGFGYEKKRNNKDGGSRERRSCFLGTGLASIFFSFVLDSDLLCISLSYGGSSQLAEGKEHNVFGVF